MEDPSVTIRNDDGSHGTDSWSISGISSSPPPTPAPANSPSTLSDDLHESRC